MSKEPGSFSRIIKSGSGAKIVAVIVASLFGTAGLSLLTVNFVFPSSDEQDPLRIAVTDGQRPSGFFLNVDITNLQKSQCYFSGEFKLVPRPEVFYALPRILQRTGTLDDSGLFQVRLLPEEPSLRPGETMSIEFLSDLPMAVEHEENIRSCFKVLTSHDYGWSLWPGRTASATSINMKGVALSSAMAILVALVGVVIKYPWLGMGTRGEKR